VYGVEQIVVGTGTGASAVTTGTVAINVNASALSSDVTITGNAGANILTGGSGNDTLNGGLGNDTLTGGLGQDTFVFSTALNATSNRDNITDFNVVQDQIALENAIFTSLGLTTGVLSASNFVSGAAAADANDWIIYNPDTGALFYDSNGSVTGGSVQIATLAAGLSLTHNDFLII
jgi:Ca2+-binding RTX toxin-like protein